jgi:two-component system chemotaxis response regulator CheB
VNRPDGTAAAGAWESTFIAMVKMVARIRVITHPRARLVAFSTRTSATVPAQHLRGPARRYEVVAIGASTGGPGAVLEILRALPADFQLPVLLVIHINEPFGTAFADWLDGQTARRVAYATDGMAVAAGAGRVIVAPPDQHLVVQEGRLRLTQAPQRHSCRPSVDVLFESIATEYGSAAAACLLTGMGRDGARGLLKVREAGGITIAQDKATSVVYGMPREAALIGAATHVLRLGDIGPRITALQGLALEVLP